MTDEITIRPWIKRGSMLINAEALDIDDPDHIYNQALMQGVDPADFGIKNPLTEQFKDKNRAQLIQEIFDLRREVLAYARGDKGL